MRTLLPLLMLATIGCMPVIPESGGPGDPDPDPDPDPLRTCDAIVADLQEEAERIQSCTRDDECGQILEGTSCGCTREWVARTDADASTFWDYVEEGTERACELPFDSPCDCPPSPGPTCLDGVCGWAPDEVRPPENFSDCSAADGAATWIDDVRVRDDQLVVDVSYSGGCAEHDFIICWPDQSFAESAPPQARLEVLHLTPGDPCDAVPSETVRFDLGPMRDAYREAFGGRGGEMLLRLDDEVEPYRFR